MVRPRLPVRLRWAREDRHPNLAPLAAAGLLAAGLLAAGVLAAGVLAVVACRRWTCTGRCIAWGSWIRCAA